jgi:hypothetical protein
VTAEAAKTAWKQRFSASRPPKLELGTTATTNARGRNEAESALWTVDHAALNLVDRANYDVWSSTPGRPTTGGEVIEDLFDLERRALQGK